MLDWLLLVVGLAGLAVLVAWREAAWSPSERAWQVLTIASLLVVAGALINLLD